MEVFVKVIAENLLAGERRIAATCFITFVALKDGKPSSVPQVLPETEEEHYYTKLALSVQKVEKRS